MNVIDIANGIVFQKLKISKESFDDRLICQKKIYLLQSLGTDLGYAYNWYVRGPYSPALTTYVFNNLDVLSSTSFNQYKLSDMAERNINIVLSLTTDIPDDLTIPSWYELLASILYIYNHRESWKHKGTDEELSNTLRKYKPQFSDSHCRKALDVLRHNSFITVGD